HSKANRRPPETFTPGVRFDRARFGTEGFAAVIIQHVSIMDKQWTDQKTRGQHRRRGARPGQWRFRCSGPDGEAKLWRFANELPEPAKHRGLEIDFHPNLGFTRIGQTDVFTRPGGSFADQGEFRWT